VVQVILNILYFFLFSVISDSKKVFAALDLHTQAFYSIVDQRYHGHHPLGKPINLILDDLHEEFSPLAHVPGIFLFFIKLFKTTV